MMTIRKLANCRRAIQAMHAGIVRDNKRNVAGLQRSFGNRELCDKAVQGLLSLARTLSPFNSGEGSAQDCLADFSGKTFAGRP